MKYLWSNTGTVQDLLNLEPEELRSILMDHFKYDTEMVGSLSADELEDLVYDNMSKFNNMDLAEFEEKWLPVLDKQTFNGWVILVGPNHSWPVKEQVVPDYYINDPDWYEDHEVSLLEDGGKLVLEFDEQATFQMYAIPTDQEGLKAFIRMCMPKAIEAKEEELTWDFEDDAEFYKNELIEKAIDGVVDEMKNGDEYHHYVDDYCEFSKVPEACKPIEAPVSDATMINYGESFKDKGKNNLKEAEEGRQGFIVWQSGGSLGDKFDLEDKIFDTREDAQAAIREWKASYGKSKSYYKPEARIYKYKGKTMKEIRAGWNNADESLEESKKLPVRKRRINEELKLYISLASYKPWSGATDVWNAICDADKQDELEYILEDMYPEGLTETQLNDLLWFDGNEVLSWLGLSENEEDDFKESLNEDEIKRYSDVVPKENRKYWYFTTHGVGPGSIPKGVNVLDTKDGKNNKGTSGTFVCLDAVLNTSELKKYDMKEERPVDESLNENYRDDSNKFIDFIDRYIQNNESDLNIEVERADKYKTQIVLTPDYDDIYQAITFYSNGAVDVEEGDMGGVNSEKEFNSYEEFMNYFKATLGDDFDDDYDDEYDESLTEAKAKKPEILKAELEEIKDLYNSWGADAFYTVPYKQFKQEFPEFAKYVIEAFLKEVVDVRLKDYSAAEVEEMWQADDDRDRLIKESDWESLFNGAETLADGGKVQWERLL